jgi:phenylacetate-CoA ligase
MKNETHKSLWNPCLEALGKQDLSLFQCKKLKDILHYAYDHSPLYRKLYDRHNISPEFIRSIRHLRDFESIPIISKKYFVSTDSDDVYGNSLAVDTRDVVFYHQTSGTTGHPLRQPDSAEDWGFTSECWSYVLWAFGIRPETKVILPFNYNTYIAFWGAHYALEKIGSEIISAGGMSSAERIRKIMELKPDAMLTTPSYAFRLAEVAKNELNVEVKDLTIRTLICAGEPGAQIENTKKHLQDLWGARVFDHIGSTEVGPWGYECPTNQLNTHVIESMYYPELLELDSDRPVNEAGTPGRLVMTNFFRHARPCIRFDTQDITQWSDEKCKCGRTHRLLKKGVIGRSDHLIKIKGTLFSISDVENIIGEFVEDAPIFEFIIEDRTIDNLVLKVELEPGIKSHDLIRHIQDTIRYRTFLNVRVVPVPIGALNRTEGKARKWIDLRRTYG